MIAYDPGNQKADYKIENPKHCFYHHNVGKEFIKQLLMTGNIPVIVVCYSQIQENIQYKGKIKQRDIERENRKTANY